MQKLDYIGMKKDLVIIALLLILSFPAIRSLLIPGAYTSHDLTHHIIRQINMDTLLSEGQFPPRWSSDLNMGYGYPLFLFNYPLPPILGEIFHKTGLNFVDSVKAVFLFSSLISIIGMYLFLKELLGPKNILGAILGAIFYLYAPIRFIDLYVAATVGASLAMGIIPYIFWAIIKLYQTNKLKYILIGGLSVAALILSHNVTALIFFPVILTFCAYLGFKSKDKLSEFKKIGELILLGLGISAWFWLPAVFEKKYLKFDEIFANFYMNQFPSLMQLIRSPWGYGLSHPQNPQNGDMSYQLGLIHILVILVLIPSLWILERIKQFREIGIFVVIIFFLSVFLMLKISLPLWENLPFLSLIQFPLRLSAISVFASSIGVALLIKYLPFKKILFVLLLILVFWANRNHWNINEVFNPGENYYLTLKTTGSSFGENLPKWGRIAEKPSPAKLEFIQGEGKITYIKNTSILVQAEVESTASSELRLNQVYFPGWIIKLDNKNASINYLKEGDSYGLMVFDLPKGSHLIKAEFINTPDRNIADIISLICVLLSLALSLKLLF